MLDVSLKRRSTARVDPDRLPPPARAFAYRHDGLHADLLFPTVTPTASGVALDPVLRGILTLKGVVIPVVTVLIVSLLGGLWPAWRAGRLDPVTALGQE